MASGAVMSSMRSYSTGTGPSRLCQWMQNISPCPKELAWCHTTDAYAFRGMVECGQFVPQPCDRFGGTRTYFFYGRPAYRLNEAALQSMGTTARAPVVIIASSEILSASHRMFPFDTGAFLDRRYCDWFHRCMELCDFELTSLVDAHRRYIASFFGTNRNYLALKPTVPPLAYAGAFEVEAMVALLQDPAIVRADDRKLAFELQVQAPIPLRAPWVRALILPKLRPIPSYLASFLNGPGQGIEVRWFDVDPYKQAKDYVTVLEALAKEMQTKWRLL